MSPSFIFGCLLAVYYFVGRWTFARLDGDYASVPLIEQPRFWLTVLLAGLALVIQNAVPRHVRRFRPTSVDGSIFIFLGYMVLTSIWATDSMLVGEKAFELVLIFFVALAIAVSRSEQFDGQLQLGFWTTIVAIGVVLGSLVLLRGGDAGVYALGGGPNTFGRNMGLMAIAAAFLGARYGVVVRLGVIGLVAVAALLVVCSGSRGGLLAFSVATAIYTISANTSLVKKSVILGAMSAATAMAFFYTVTGQEALGVFRGRIVEQTLENHHLAGRDDLWIQALEMAQERPVFGWGLDGFRANSWNYPHNIFLEVLVEGGLVGLLLLLNVGRAWRAHFKRLRYRLPRVPLVAFALTFTAAQTSGDLFDSRGVFLMAALATPSINSVRRRAIPSRTTRQLPANGIPIRGSEARPALSSHGPPSRPRWRSEYQPRAANGGR